MLRVSPQDQRPHVVLEADFSEVSRPALGRDQRVVAAEQDAVFQLRAGVLHSRAWHAAFEQIQFGRVPVIAVLQGAVVGGGGGSACVPRRVGMARIGDMSPSDGLVTESLMAAIAGAEPAAKERMRAFLDGNAGEGSKS